MNDPALFANINTSNNNISKEKNNKKTHILPILMLKVINKIYSALLNNNQPQIEDSSCTILVIDNSKSRGNSSLLYKKVYSQDLLLSQNASSTSTSIHAKTFKETCTKLTNIWSILESTEGHLTIDAMNILKEIIQIINQFQKFTLLLNEQEFVLLIKRVIKQFPHNQLEQSSSISMSNEELTLRNAYFELDLTICDLISSFNSNFNIHNSAIIKENINMIVNHVVGIFSSLIDYLGDNSVKANSHPLLTSSTNMNRFFISIQSLLMSNLFKSTSSLSINQWSEIVILNCINKLMNYLVDSKDIDKAERLISNAVRLKTINQLVYTLELFATIDLLWESILNISQEDYHNSYYTCFDSFLLIIQYSMNQITTKEAFLNNELILNKLINSYLSIIKKMYNEIMNNEMMNKIITNFMNLISSQIIDETGNNLSIYSLFSSEVKHQLIDIWYYIHSINNAKFDDQIFNIFYLNSNLNEKKYYVRLLGMKYNDNIERFKEIFNMCIKLEVSNNEKNQELIELVNSLNCNNAKDVISSIYNSIIIEDFAMLNYLKPIFNEIYQIEQ